MCIRIQPFGTLKAVNNLKKDNEKNAQEKKRKETCNRQKQYSTDKHKGHCTWET